MDHAAHTRIGIDRQHGNTVSSWPCNETLEGPDTVKAHLVDIRLLKLGERSLEVEVLLRHRHRRHQRRPRRRRATLRAICLLMLMMVLLVRLRRRAAGAPATAADAGRAAAPPAATSASAAAVTSASPPALCAACTSHAPAEGTSRTSSLLVLCVLTFAGCCSHVVDCGIAPDTGT